MNSETKTASDSVLKDLLKLDVQEESPLKIAQIQRFHVVLKDVIEVELDRTGGKVSILDAQVTNTEVNSQMSEFNEASENLWLIKPPLNSHSQMIVSDCCVRFIH
jgi:hypothetical protein